VWVPVHKSRRPLVRYLLLISALVASTSCYPWHETYFSPSTATESAVPNKCAFRIGARGSLKLNLGPATLFASMNPGAKYLEIFVAGIRAQGLTLSHGPVIISSPRGPQSHLSAHLTVTEVLTDPRDRRMLQPNYHQSQEMLYTHDVQMDMGYQYEFVIKELPVEEPFFILSMPSLRLNGQTLSIPPITFTKITEWRMEPVVLNC
jgi:hypothetical protein